MLAGLASSLRHSCLQANNVFSKPTAANMRLISAGVKPLTSIFFNSASAASPDRQHTARSHAAAGISFLSNSVYPCADEGMQVLHHSEELANKMYQRLAELGPELEQLNRWVDALQKDLQVREVLPGLVVQPCTPEQQQKKMAWLTQLEAEVVEKMTEMESLIDLLRKLDVQLQTADEQSAAQSASLALDKAPHMLLAPAVDTASPDTPKASRLFTSVQPAAAQNGSAIWSSGALRRSIRAGLTSNQRSTFGRAPSVGLRMSARSFCTPPKDPNTRAGHVGSIGRNTQDIEAGLDGLDGDGDGDITRQEWILKYGSADGFQEFDTQAPYGVLQGTEIGNLEKVDDGHGRPRYWETDSWKTERYASPPDGLIGAHPGNYPTLIEAAQQQRHYYEYSNNALLILSLQGNPDAMVERLIREIMHVDQVHWRVAAQTVVEIEKASGTMSARLFRMPYSIGAVGATCAGFISLPMVFSPGFTMWFNDHFVTAEMPPPEELATIMETGMWSWGWMEPPLGTLSFLLLSMQFARQQTNNLWLSKGAQGPYNAWLKKRRFKLMVSKFPDYSPLILQEYCSVLTARSAQSTARRALENDDKYNTFVSHEKLDPTTIVPADQPELINAAEAKKLKRATKKAGEKKLKKAKKDKKSK